MAEIKIDVASYAGSRGEEDVPERKRNRFFRLKGSDGLLHTLYCDMESHQILRTGFRRSVRLMNPMSRLSLSTTITER